jgi:hypothetical protein
MMMLTMTTFMAMMLTQCSAMSDAERAARRKVMGKCLQDAGHRVVMGNRVINEIQERLKKMQEKLLKDFEEESAAMFTRQGCDHDFQDFLKGHTACKDILDYQTNQVEQMERMVDDIPSTFSEEEMIAIKSSEKEMIATNENHAKKKKKKNILKRATNAIKVAFTYVKRHTKNEIQKIKNNAKRKLKKFKDFLHENKKGWNELKACLTPLVFFRASADFQHALSSFQPFLFSCKKSLNFFNFLFALFLIFCISFFVCLFT